MKKKLTSLLVLGAITVGFSAPSIVSTSFAEDGSQMDTIPSTTPSEKNIVKHIIVEGNKNITADNILKLVTKTKIGDEYSKDTVQADLSNIIKSGMVQHATARSVQNNGELYIVFEITEVSDIKNIVLTGNTLINSSEINQKLITKPGMIFNKDNIDKDVETIKNLYKDKGYVAIVSDVNNNNGSVTFTISEAKVEDIKYTGNNKTKTWVMDKTVTPIIKKGDLLTTSSLQNIYNNLMSTGFFEDVKINADNGSSKNDVVLNITVKESKTGEWNLGGGYNDQYKAQFIGGLRDNNINGEAKSIGFNFGIGKNKTTYNLEYTDPYYKKTDTQVTFDVFKSSKNVEYNDSEFTEDHTGASIGMIKPISKDKKTKFFTNFTMDNIGTEVVSGSKVEGIKSNTITLGIMNDRRDNPTDPTSGSLSSIALTTSQKIFGSDYDFTKITTEFKKYSKISSKDVLATRFAFNYSPDDLPTVEQFTIGGSDSVRGLDEDAQRGNSSILATLELRHDLSDKVQGVVFIDAGKAWQDSVDNAMKVATGVGLRIKTSMGILRLDAAKSGGESMKYMFGIGHSF